MSPGKGSYSSSVPPLPMAYSPITQRNRLVWPNDSRVAVWVIPNVEAFRAELPITSSSGVLDVPELAIREYGARIGVFRLMDTLERLGIPATAALNSDVCKRYPEIIESGTERAWEWMGHNETNSVRLNQAGANEEAIISSAIETIRASCGTAPVGWLSSGLQETAATLDILAKHGVKYVADWVADDQPFWLNTGERRLVSLPYSTVLNDKPAVEQRNLLPWEFGELIRRQFDELYKEGAKSGRVLAVALHPYLSGQPYFIKDLEAALGYVAEKPLVWLAHGSEIAECFIKQSVENERR